MNLNFILIAIVCGFLFAILAAFYGIYVSVIQKKNKVKEAFYSIDVQLQKRYDLIPNILAIAKKFMEHEKTLIEEVTNLRVEALKLAQDYNSINDKIKIDNQIEGKLGQLMVSVENYPQLKSDQTMVEAMKTYQDVEEHIAAARRFYNSAALELKNAVEIFPSSFVASMLGIRPVDFFSANEDAKKPISAEEYFNK